MINFFTSLNAEVRKFGARHPRIFSFLQRRLRRDTFSGLPLTLVLVVFVYVAALFLEPVRDSIVSIVSGPIIAADIRVAHLLATFRDAELITFFTWVTLFGKWQIIVSGTVVATIILWIWHRRVYIFPLLVTLIGTEVVTAVGKLALHRPRPEAVYYAERGFSFPSGHAAIAVAFYGFLVYVLLRETKQWGRKATILFWGLVIILAIGFSRLYLGVHYVSDVWGGYLSGLLLLLVGIALVEWKKHQQPQ